MFRAIKQHVTGTYHGKQRHGMNLLIAKNKTSLLNIFQRSTEKMIGSMQTWQMIYQIQTVKITAHGRNNDK